MRYTIVRLRYKYIYIMYVCIYTKGYYVELEQIGRDRKREGGTCANREERGGFRRGDIFFFLDNDDVILATEQLLEIKTPDKARETRSHSISMLISPRENRGTYFSMMTISHDGENCKNCHTENENTRQWRRVIHETRLSADKSPQLFIGHRYNCI